MSRFLKNGAFIFLGVMILEIVAAKIRVHALAALELCAFSLHEVLMNSFLIAIAVGPI
jgi:hypothetical protein